MTNPQDIKAAPDLWRIAASLERSANWLLRGIRGGAKSAPHASAPDMLAAAAALRAVQEPVVLTDAEIEDALNAIGRKHVYEWPDRHEGVWSGDYIVSVSDVRSIFEALATPPPPGAASPGVPARPPYKYSWPGDPSPD